MPLGLSKREQEAFKIIKLGAARFKSELQSLGSLSDGTVSNLMILTSPFFVGYKDFDVWFDYFEYQKGISNNLDTKVIISDFSQYRKQLQSISSSGIDVYKIMNQSEPTIDDSILYNFKLLIEGGLENKVKLTEKDVSKVLRVLQKMEIPPQNIDRSNQKLQDSKLISMFDFYEELSEEK